MDFWANRWDLRRMRRRDFLRTSVGIALGGGLVGARAATSERATSRAGERVTLGRTGIKVSRLALGTGSNGWNGASNQTRQLGIGGVADLLEEAFERGVNFWDAADQYGSHPNLAEGLKRVPRDKVVILTKSNSEDAAGMRADIDRFRKELGTDRIDVLLLHCKTSPNWVAECAGAMEVMADAKERGIIGAHGVSCHSFEALELAARTDWVEVDLARINPAGAVMDAPVDRVLPVLQQMHADGKGVIGMKIFGAGRLARKMDECLRYVMKQDCVPTFSIGCESRRQLREVIDGIERA